MNPRAFVSATRSSFASFCDVARDYFNRALSDSTLTVIIITDYACFFADLGNPLPPFPRRPGLLCHNR
eukprot:NODE_28089_length_490_cov_1.112948.p1 GENE.NODE_28089_length_490_cov_1.112948~~NODE_28089_length_490_cov_1.112948.p1  ORF type:complete len:68 (+),score=0.96 NODE_28089_length_490_cov_1.112948:102-305(+)